MSNLNRKQRRAMQHGKRNQEYVTLEEPRYLTKWRTFDGIDRILTSIENGELLAENGIPVFLGVSGERCQVAPSLEGWVMMWKHATLKLNLPVDTYTPFELLRRCLAADQLISSTLVEVARICYKLQRDYYDQHPYETWHQIARDVRIKIHLAPETRDEQAEEEAA